MHRKIYKSQFLQSECMKCKFVSTLTLMYIQYFPELRVYST